MSLTEVLSDLPSQSKKSFLERLLPSAKTLNAVDFAMVSKAAAEVSVDLGVEYLLAKERGTQAITLLEEAGNLIKAAQLCEKHGLKDCAAENYELTGVKDNIQKAAEIYLGVKYELELGTAERDVSALEKEGKHAEAAEVCQNAGMVARAVHNLELAGKSSEALMLVERFDPLKAAEVWERNGYLTEAENLLFRNGLFKELAALNERAGYLVSAAANYIRIEDLDSALRCYKQDKFNWGVENILRQLGKEEELVEYWHETKNFSSLAAHYKKSSPAQAAAYYEELREYQTAAKCLVKAKKPIEAMQLLVRNNFYEEAVKIGDTTKTKNPEDTTLKQVLMTQCYEELAPRYENSDPERALKYYSKLERPEKVKKVATDLSEQSAAKGDFEKASKYAALAGDSKATTFEAADDLLRQYLK